MIIFQPGKNLITAKENLGSIPDIGYLIIKKE